MTEFEINELMRKSLSVTENPPKKLNDSILRQAKERNMKKKNLYRKVMTAAAVAAVFLGVSTTAVAAYHMLNASSAARELDRGDLADSFTKNNILEDEVKKQGSAFEVTLLGVLTGERMGKDLAEGMDVQQERTYAAVAIARTDGNSMQEDQDLSFFVSPLIQGLDPAFYNIASMNGSISWKVMDGVLYYLVDCDDIACFADRSIYLAVMDRGLYDNQAYSYDESSGKIARREEYQGLNLLFDLALDPALADPQKAAAYLQELERRWKEPAPEEEGQEPKVEDILARATLLEDSVKEVTWDENGGIYYEYSFGFENGVENMTNYSSFGPPFAEGETGYQVVTWSENGEGEKTYILLHKDENGKVTGMIYKE